MKMPDILQLLKASDHNCVFMYQLYKLKPSQYWPNIQPKKHVLCTTDKVVQLNYPQFSYLEGCFCVLLRGHYEFFSYGADGERLLIHKLSASRLSERLDRFINDWSYNPENNPNGWHVYWGI